MAVAAVQEVRKAVSSLVQSQEGVGRIASRLIDGKTRLTEVSHKSPARCIPLLSTSHSQSATCAMSSYGGGMVGGDQISWKIDVGAGSRLAVTTQGSNRIYKARHSRDTPDSCKATLHAKIEENGLLVVAPDPVVPFQHSKYQQDQHFELTSPSCSLLAIDWFAAGRLSKGERWKQQHLRSRSVVSMENEVVLIDSTQLDQSSTYGLDWSSNKFNCFGSVLLYGSQVHDTVSRFYEAQEALTALYTRVRNKTLSIEGENSGKFNAVLDTLSGSVSIGVSECKLPSHITDEPLFVARFAATSNDDMYRVFRHCLDPLDLSGCPYADRIHSVHSAPQEVLPSVTDEEMSSPAWNDEDGIDERLMKQVGWPSLILSDSALPVGGFAHSSGLEAAHQLNMINSEDDLHHFARLVCHSNMNLYAPFVFHGHALQKLDINEFSNAWNELNNHMHTLMISNEPANESSLEQGRNYLRLVQKWIESRGMESANVGKLKAALALDYQHLAPSFGLATAMLGLPADQSQQLLRFCVSRDVVSAAVRLNIVGPMASVPLLHSLHALTPEVSTRLEDASSCAPVLDAIHPKHSLLSTRLFRS